MLILHNVTINTIGHSEMADNTDTKEQVVTPWTAHAAEGANTIDYDKLIGNFIYGGPSVSCDISPIVQFGSQRIDQSLLDRIEAVTKKPPHHFLRRKIFFSHR